MTGNILTTNGIKPLLLRPGTSYIEKFGRNASVASGTSEDIWDGGGIYDFPDVASKFDISSTSAEDGAGTQTGALTVSVQGLDQNFDQITETLTLNGLTAVETTNTFIRIFRMRVETAGSNGTNVGVITADSQAEVLTAAQISAGNGQTNMALYTIPRGHVGFLKRWYVSLLRATGTNAIAVDVDMFRRNFGGAWRSTQPVGFQNNGAGMHQYDFYAPIEFPAKSDIVVNATPTAAADVAAGFTMLITHDNI